MLTRDLIAARVVRGSVRPAYIDAEAPEHLALAESLIEVFQEHLGAPRGALQTHLEERLGTGTSFLLHRGLAKLLFDRTRFEIEAAAEPSEVRRAVFAAAAHQRLGEESAFDREAALTQAAAELEISPEAAEGALFADLKSEQCMTEFKSTTADWLLRRYNVALAQGVLLGARGLTLEIVGGKASQHRELLRKVKFFRLLHSIEERPGKGLVVHLDGPISLLRSSQRYGLAMASFLPTLLHFENWKLEAEVVWGRQRRERGFSLKAGALSPISHLMAQWQPEEIRRFGERFAALDAGWEMLEAPAFVRFDAQTVVVPDFRFRHLESGYEATLEILGYWRRSTVRTRVAMLERSRPKGYLLALSKSLAGDRDGAKDLPREIYLFRKQPIPREVLARIEALREREATGGSSGYDRQP